MDAGEKGLRPELRARGSVVSRLSSEVSSTCGSAEDQEVVRCRRCGSADVKGRWRGLGGNERRVLVCGGCGGVVE